MSLINFNRKKSVMPTFNSWVDNIFKDDDGFFTKWNNTQNFPPVNVEETKTEYNLSLAAPGLKKEDFNIEIKDNSLIISSESSDSSEEVDENFTRREYSFNSFQRSFWLPENVNEEDIKANYQDGILNVTIAKSAIEKPELSKKIEVA